MSNYKPKKLSSDKTVIEEHRVDIVITAVFVLLFLFVVWRLIRAWKRC